MEELVKLNMQYMEQKNCKAKPSMLMGLLIIY